MTIHQAKGLGFPYVFLVDMTDEYFPSLERNISLFDGQSSRLLSSALKKYFAKSSVSFPYFEFFTKLEERLEEERQLVYVALTRAGRRLSINYPEESHLGEPVEPSPFLDEFIGEGGQLNDIPPSSDGSGVVKQLENALSRDEIENLVHACLHASTAPDAVNEAVALLAPLGLDKKYLCARHPFEPESAAPPSIENHHFSASQLSTYLTCPRRFFYERLLRIAPERERELAVGQLIHLTLQTFHERHKIFDADHAALERELLLIFENVWKGEGGQQPAQGFEILFPTGLQRWAIKTRAVEILKRYLKTELAHAADTNVIACERFLEFQVRGRLFRARIDRIDAVRDLAGHKIIDYKTSRSGPMGAKTIKKLFLNLDDAPDYIPQDFQLPLYLLAGRAEGYHPVELAYYWVAQTNSAGMFKKSSLTVGVEEDCLTPEEMGAAEAAIVEVTSRILAGDFPAAPRSPFECQWCSFAGICER
jgi:ATP-dependent exoDNAse (exonuclease V) beta subunit